MLVRHVKKTKRSPWWSPWHALRHRNLGRDLMTLVASSCLTAMLIHLSKGVGEEHGLPHGLIHQHGLHHGLIHEHSLAAQNAAHGGASQLPGSSARTSSSGNPPPPNAWTASLRQPFHALSLVFTRMVGGKQSAAGVPALSARAGTERPEAQGNPLLEGEEDGQGEGDAGTRHGDGDAGVAEAGGSEAATQGEVTSTQGEVTSPQARHRRRRQRRRRHRAGSQATGAEATAVEATAVEDGAIGSLLPGRGGRFNNTAVKRGGVSNRTVLARGDVLDGAVPQQGDATALGGAPPHDSGGGPGGGLGGVNSVRDGLEKELVNGTWVVEAVVAEGRGTGDTGDGSGDGVVDDGHLSDDEPDNGPDSEPDNGLFHEPDSGSVHEPGTVIGEPMGEIEDLVAERGSSEDADAEGSEGDDDGGDSGGPDGDDGDDDNVEDGVGDEKDVEYGVGDEKDVEYGVGDEKDVEDGVGDEKDVEDAVGDEKDDEEGQDEEQEGEVEGDGEGRGISQGAGLSGSSATGEDVNRAANGTGAESALPAGGVQGLAGAMMDGNVTGPMAATARLSSRRKYNRAYRDCAANPTGPPPNLDGIPLALPPTIPLEDIFIHQKNHARLRTGKFAVPPSAVHLLPRDGAQVLRRYSFKSCAIVGNSGALRFMKLGNTIDTHDLVVRTNQAPIRNYRLHVGQKTTMRVMNKAWTSHYSSGRWKEEGLPLEYGISIIITRSPGKSVAQMHHSLMKIRPDIRILQLSSRIVTACRSAYVQYRVALCKAGYGPFIGGATPTSGLVLTYVLMQLCKHVTLYGFGQAGAHRLGGVTGHVVYIPYHYYAGVGARAEGDLTHSFEAEEAFLRQLDREHFITMCRLPTGDITPESLYMREYCGINPAVKIVQGPANLSSFSKP
eukprot:jgi/Mesvir1/18263/Mv09533-RA.1